MVGSLLVARHKYWSNSISWCNIIMDKNEEDVWHDTCNKCIRSCKRFKTINRIVWQCWRNALYCRDKNEDSLYCKNIKNAKQTKTNSCFEVSNAEIITIRIIIIGVVIYDLLLFYIFFCLLLSLLLNTLLFSTYPF